MYLEIEIHTANKKVQYYMSLLISPIYTVLDHLVDPSQPTFFLTTSNLQQLPPWLEGIKPRMPKTMFTNSEKFIFCAVLLASWQVRTSDFYGNKNLKMVRGITGGKILKSTIFTKKTTN